MTQVFDIIFSFLFIILIIISFVCVSTIIKNKMFLKSEFWTDWGMYLAHPGKIFSAEMQVPIHRRILEQPTKCFSCEKQYIRTDPSKLYLANPTKCFDCERQILAYNT
jgi:hypothetical protein